MAPGIFVTHDSAAHVGSADTHDTRAFAVRQPNSVSQKKERVCFLESVISIITGPSKTADIEMNLVTGVHGPGVVQVYVVR
jgi:hypothetical protein